MRFPGFIGPSYTSRSVNIDCQRSVNLYPEIDEQQTGKEGEVAALVGTPGLSLLATIGSGPIRGVYRGINDILYVVSGNTLYSVTSSWVSTSLGTLSTSVGPVSMVDDGYNLIIVDGAYGYDWNFASASFIVIVTSGFLGGTQVTFQDSYFIFDKPGTNIFYLSDIPSGSPTATITFNTGFAALKEGFNDNIIGIISVHQNLWLLGERTTAVYYNSGASDFPFAIIQGAFLQQGCASAFSVAQISNTLFWLGQTDQGSGAVYMANGYVPQRISTHAVELAIQGYATISDATAFTYQSNGHNFYVLNFTSAQATWVYDTTTNLWHERAYLNGGLLQRHRADNHTFCYNTHIVGDYANGNIYAMSDAVFTDNGAPILRLRTAPHLSKDLDRVFYGSFQLDIESGVGLDGITQGTSPQAMLKFSDDGGHTWSNEKWTGMGLIGQTKARAIWRRLGAARDRVFSVTITEPVKVILIGAKLELMAGAN